MENHQYQSQEVYITCIVLGHVMNDIRPFWLIKVYERTMTTVPHFVNSCRSPAGLCRGPCWSPGSSQHCCFWVDPCVLLRPAQEYSFRLTEGLQQPGKCWTRGGLREPGKIIKTSNLVTLHDSSPIK